LQPGRDVEIARLTAAGLDTTGRPIARRRSVTRIDTGLRVRGERATKQQQEGTHLLWTDVEAQAGVFEPGPVSYFASVVGPPPRDAGRLGPFIDITRETHAGFRLSLRYAAQPPTGPARLPATVAWIGVQSDASEVPAAAQDSIVNPLHC
jgi:hypothetical protein